MLRRYFPTLALAVLTLAFILRVVGIEKPARYMFDEDFFAFTANLVATNDQRAYEWWHGPLATETSTYTYRPPAVEWLHPPLSKLLQAASISLLGNIPLAWRLPSAIAGVCVVLLLMYLTRVMFHSSAAALLVGFAASFEHLLVVQSRIASPDVFVVLFVLLTLAAYWSYHRQRTLSGLIATGICFGLAIATKWTAALLLPGVALFELWFWMQTKPKKIHASSLYSWLMFCLSVCGISLLVYVASFTQFFSQGRSINEFVELHKQIWHYQTTTQFTHPGSSQPWQWLLGQKPILYYMDESGKPPVVTISAQPTLIVLFASEVAVFVAMYLIVRERKKHSEQWWATLLLLLTVTSLYLPLWLITRPLFVYHFAPILSVVLVLAGGQLARVLPDPKT